MLLTNKNFSLDILNQAIDVQCFSDSFWCLPEENNIYFAVCLPCMLCQWPCLIRLQGLISELVKSPTYSGMSTIVVTPPAAAALVAVQKPSQEVRPGSFTWTWQSTMPGITTLSPTSSTFQPQKSFLNNAMNQASERNKIFRSVKSVNYNFTDRRIILSSVLRSETQLTWQATSSEKLQLETISCIFPSFITTTAGRTLSPSSTLVLLTALTVDPSSMFLFLLTVIELSTLDSH